VRERIDSAVNRPVVAGLDPAIHAFFCRERFKTWTPGTDPGMTEFIPHLLSPPITSSFAPV
jgi:hypothetical protein